MKPATGILTAIPFGSILYSGSQVATQALSEVATLGAQYLTSTLSTVNPNLGSLSNRTFSFIGNTVQGVQQQVTEALNIPRGSPVQVSDFVGPVLVTFGLGVMAARSAVLATKHAKMFFCCERTEVLERREASVPGVRVRDRNLMPHTGTGLALSAVANTLLVPIFLYLGKETQSIIVDQLREVVIVTTPAEYIVKAGVVLYAAYPIIKYFNS